MASSDNKDSLGSPSATQTDPAVANLIQAVRDDLMTDGIGEGTNPHGGVGQMYLDTADPPNPTIGWGANLNVPYNQQLLEQQGADVQAVIDGKQTISEEQAKQLLDLDIGHALSDARATFPNFDTLDPHAQQALTEMSFNLGYPTLHGDAQHHGFPALQADLSRDPPDYAAAAGEVHVQNIGNERNEHYHDLMEQAAADQKEAPTAFHEQPAHSFLFDAKPDEALSGANPYAAPAAFGLMDNPHEFAQPQVFETAPALSEQIQLPAGLLNTDFGTGGTAPIAHEHQSALPDAFQATPVASAPDPASDSQSGGFSSGVQDFFSSFTPPPTHVEATEAQSAWSAPHDAPATPEPVAPSMFDHGGSLYSSPTPAPEPAASAYDHDSGSVVAPSHHDSGLSFGSLFGGGESQASAFAPSHESSHSTDSGYSHYDSGYSNHDSVASHHDSGASTHDSGSHDSGGGHDAGGSSE